jgi:hypothetical protein
MEKFSRPWTANLDFKTMYYVQGLGGTFEGLSIFDADDDLVAIVPVDVAPLYAAKNARLITAAPDLLAALKSFRHADGCFCEAAFVGPDQHVPHTRECVTACIVIKKAEAQP